MFCNKCGTQIPDGSAFCSSCGYDMSGGSANGAPVDYVAQFQRTQEIQAQQYQMQKKAVRKSEMDLLKKVFDYFNLKRELYNELTNATANYLKFSRKAKSGLIVWGIIIFILGFIMVKSFEIIEIAICLCLPALGMVFGGIMMKVNNKKNREYYESESARLSEELYTYYKAYPQCPIGFEYTDPEVIQEIMDVLDSGRADTIKEAIEVRERDNVMAVFED